MFNIYITDKANKKKGSKENKFVKTAIECLARKYNVIKGKNDDKSIILFNFEKNELNIKKTCRFIAKQTTAFLNKMEDSNVVGVGAGKYASRRQINNLLNDNSGNTSVNSLILLIVIFKLLQYSTDSKEYQEIIHKSAKTESEYTEYKPKDFLFDPLHIKDNCATCFLEGKMINILNRQLNLSTIQCGLADFLIACSDTLDELVTCHADDAITIGAGYPDKKREFRDILPSDMPNFPHN